MIKTLVSPRFVITEVEPSKRLSEILGFRYTIERRFFIRELLKKGVIIESDIKDLEMGKIIKKRMKIKEPRL